LKAINSTSHIIALWIFFEVSSILTQDDIKQFANNGFLVKRNFFSKDLVDKALNCFLESWPRSKSFDKNGRNWYGPFNPKEECSGNGLIRSGYRWLDRRKSKEDWIVKGFLLNPNLKLSAEQLMGVNNLLTPTVIRGIYATLPSQGQSEFPLHPHVDTHPFSLGVVTYLMDISSPGAGAFTVWPESHLKMNYSFINKVGEQKTFDHNIILRETLDQINPLEILAQKGDLIFWHHRLIHAAGINHSITPRVALFADLFHSQFKLLMIESSCVNLWKDWSPQLR
tara:strand:+ start:32 stop:877 length:846 start_codon:yes stop_codon:yes gene_type:complete